MESLSKNVKHAQLAIILNGIVNQFTWIKLERHKNKTLDHIWRGDKEAKINKPKNAVEC